MTLDLGFDGQEQIGEWVVDYGSAAGRTWQWGLLELAGTTLWWLCTHREGSGRGRSGRRGAIRR
jgi:hypothetical protein